MAPPARKFPHRGEFSGRGQQSFKRDKNADVFKRLGVGRLFECIDIRNCTAVVNETKLLEVLKEATEVRL